MKLISALLILLTACSCAASAPEAIYPEYSATETALDSVVGLVDSDGTPYCAGVAWQSRVLTAAHCTDVEGTETLVAFRPDDVDGYFANSFRYSVVYHDEEQDIAVLSPLELVSPPEEAILSPDGPFTGQHVVAVGHPMGLTYTVTDGVVSRPRRTRFGQTWMQVSSPVYFGNSGGPVFSRYGEIMGITSFLVLEPHLAGAVHLEVLKDVASQVH